MSTQYIVKIARHTIGKNRLEHLRKMRADKGITPECIRLIFMLDVMRVVSKMNPRTLGEICCSLSAGVTFGEYKDRFLVTTGTNAWSAVFLSEADCGKTLLQKIAVAGLLQWIFFLIDEQQLPFQNSNIWMPIELVDQSEDLVKKGDEAQALARALGWES